MATIALRAPRGLSLALAGLFCLTMLAPLSALADTNLEIGGTAVVAYANGDDVRLRSEPTYAASVITLIPEGTTVDVLDGPIWAADGSAWYGISVWDQSGYMVADFLALAGEPAVAADSGTAEGDAAGAVSTAAVVGTGTIAGTNGDGVRCRAGAGYDAAIITVLAEGATVSLTGSPVGEWQPVICAGTNGYVHASFVSTGAAPVDPGTTDGGTTDPGATDGVAAVTGYATVAGTNGGGLRCRADASYDAAIITVLAEGTEVGLTGGLVGEWQPVVCAGSNGFVHASFLSTGGGATNPTDGGTTDGGTTDGGSGTVTGSAVVSGTNGGGLRCRAGAGYDAAIITVLAEGATVSLTGGLVGEWQPVICAGTSGYVHSSFLSTGAPTTGTPDGGTTDGGTTDGGTGTVTGYATVAGTNGGGLRCRADASYGAAIITVLPEGLEVELRGSVVGEWQPVICAKQNGFVHSSYLAAPGTANPVPDDGGTDGGSGGLAAGDHAATTANLNLRYDASYGSGIAAVAPAGTVVAITGAPVNGFYPIDWDGLGGYMHGDYLVWTDAALSERGGSAAPSPDTGNSGGSATGSAIANFGLQYVGYPYVWAGEGPYGFDCSGFTMYVIRQVLGINITHDMFTQLAMGTPVSYGNLQPGDLVFFQNTFRWGLSHVGIYIGNNQFVHAENEMTGVKVSDITSQYYSTRYYGAVRFT